MKVYMSTLKLPKGPAVPFLVGAYRWSAGSFPRAALTRPIAEPKLDAMPNNFAQRWRYRYDSFKSDFDST